MKGAFFMTNTPVVQDRRWVSLSDAADYCGMNERSLRRFVQAGKLKAYRVGSKTIRLDLNEVDAMFSLIPTAAIQ